MEASTGNPTRFRVLWDKSIPGPPGQSLGDVQVTEQMNTSRNPFGLVVLMAGAAAMMISGFLPGTHFSFLVGALGISITGYQAYQKPAQWSQPFTFALFATLFVGALLSRNRWSQAAGVMRAGENLDRQAIYVNAIGCVLALVGSLMLRQSAGSGQRGLK